MTTYTKLRDGSWGLRAQGSLTAGQAVSVRKKDGSAKTETVGRILWTGDGITLATIAGGDSRPAGRSRSAVCGECGKGGRLVRDLEDGCLKHYQCCDIPPGGY